GDQVKQVGLGHALDLGVKLKALENVARLGREALHVLVQVLADVVLVADQGGQVQGTGVVEASTADDALEERVRVDSSVSPLLVLGQHLGLGRRQYAVQAAQHGERQDDLAVLGLLVIAAEQVRDGPDEGRKSLLVQGISRFNNESGRPARDPEVRMIEAPRLSGALGSMLSAATPRDSRGPASCTPGTD